MRPPIRALVAAVIVASGVGTALVLSNRATEAPAQRFLDRHLLRDGRVSRDSGDTVSEGQAYAMLLATGIGSRDAFDLAWGWAKDNLIQPEGYMAWLWSDGEVVDTQPAPDADVDAAVALVRAAELFAEPGYLEEAKALAAAILEHSTVTREGTLLLAAGPWATGDPVIINPSYLDPPAFDLLAEATGDARWDELAQSGRHVIDLLTRGPSLPPDWASTSGGGPIRPLGSPSDPSEPARWGFDAFRVPIRLGSSCEPFDRALAARAWQILQRGDSQDLGIKELDGAPAGPPNPVALVGAAGAAHGAGDSAARQSLLEEAEHLGERAGDYYSAAWIALGRLFLDGKGLRC